MALTPLDPAETPQAIIEPLCAVFRKALKAEGLKYTAERAHVLDAVVRREGLFSADQILADLKRHRVSKATVYRTIRHLLDAGIIHRVLIDAHHATATTGGLYQLAYGSRTDDLLIHLDTLTAEPITDPTIVAGLAKLRDQLCTTKGLDAKGHRFTIYATTKPTRA